MSTLPSQSDLSQLALQMYQQSAHGAALRAGDLLVQAKRVSRWLGAVAAVQTLLALLAWRMVGAMAGSALATEVLGPVLKISALSMTFMAALFWGLWIWSKRAALPPALAGLTIYTTMWWVTSAYAWATLARRLGEDGAMRVFQLDGGTLLRWLVTIGLVRAVICGVKHRRISEKLAAGTLQHTDEPAVELPLAAAGAANERRRIAGITTSLALFAVMLYVILDLIALWGTSELTPTLFRKMVLANAIIVLTWSGACWRDVFRPLAKAINPLWYLASIALGFVTFAMASGWMTLVRGWSNLPAPDASALATGESWTMQLMLVAVAPAVIEELAFRGVIFGALARTLKGWETVVVTALMFMVLHATVPAFPHLLVSGVIFGLLRLKTGSWLPGVFMHFTHNFLVLLTASAPA